MRLSAGKKALSGCLLALQAIGTSAIHLRVEGRRNQDLLGRGNLNGSSPLSNSADISYYSDITLGGQTYTVLIDTGSSDLWVAGTVPNAKDSGKDTGVNYAVGGAEGSVKTADLEFAGFSIKDQAFIEVTVDDDHPDGEGLIGLGPVQGSNIYEALGDDQDASTVLDRIFISNTSTSNFLTVLLGRTDDPTDIYTGDITVGVYVDGFDGVKDMPKISVSVVPVKEDSDQHFQFLMDEGGILGPDGESIDVTTKVDETKNKKQLTAVVDTGFSLSQVPKKVASSVYSRFEGAQLTNVTGIGEVWLVPCDQEVNMTFVIQDKHYPIHPMDTTIRPSTLGMGDLTADGKKLCIGLFQPFSFDNGDSPNYDMILGMSFLRNAYTVFNFGDFVADNKDSRGDPYLQFLATTDASNGHSDFVTVRLDGTDTTGSQTLLPASDTGDGDGVDSDDDGPDQTTKTLILAFSIVGAVVAAGMVAAIIIHCRRSSKRKAGAVAYPGFGAGAGSKYVQLGDEHHHAAMGYAAPPGGDTAYHGATSYPPPPPPPNYAEPLYDPHGQGLTGGIQSGPMYDPYTPNQNPPLQHSIQRS